MGFLDIFGKKAEPVLGIDIGSSSIKVVQIHKKNGQAVLDTYGELALGPYANAIVGQAVNLPPERLAQALKDLMKEKEVNVTTKSCGISIPFASSLMTEMQLPAVSQKQLATMVPIEARKYIPVPITEVQLDWSIIPSAGGPGSLPAEAKPADGAVSKVDLLVVAIQNTTLERYRKIVELAEVEASFFEIELFSTMRAVVDEPLRPVMIMDMGAATTKLYLVERGIVKASHTINRGAQDITKMAAQSLGMNILDAEVAKRQGGLLGDEKLASAIKLSLDYIFAEANQALLAYEKKYNRAVAKIYLVGGGSSLKGLDQAAKDNFKTEIVSGDPFSKLATPAFLAPTLRETGPEFAVAIGLALRKLTEQE